ncbi:MAG: NUDIX domain-containing protein [Anaerolineales bacterium]|nr:NUDIX domain-containing protein [Anaerolineales bacterium]
MTQVLRGKRIGKNGRVRLGCSAVIFDEAREKVLLTKRADNGLWCLPSGGVDPGECVEETILREVWEETGLTVRVRRLVGVYSDPDWLVVYPDDNAVQIVALSFEAEITAGKPGLSDETSDWGYFSLEEVSKMDMLLNHHIRIQDALEGQVAAFIK